MKNENYTEHHSLQKASSTSFFSDSSLLSLVASNGKSIKYKAGDKLFSQGAPCEGVYIVTQGIVKTTKKVANKKEFLLWFAGVKDVLGLEVCFGHAPFGFSAAPMSKTATVSFISKNVFQNFLNSIPRLKSELIEVLCDRIKFTENRLASLLQKRTQERLVETLTFLSEKWKGSGCQKKQEGSSCLNINEFSLVDLADLIGTTEGYLKKILPDFQAKGLIQRNGSLIKIKSAEKIKQILNHRQFATR